MQKSSYDLCQKSKLSLFYQILSNLWFRARNSNLLISHLVRLLCKCYNQTPFVSTKPPCCIPRIWQPGVVNPFCLHPPSFPVCQFFLRLHSSRRAQTPANGEKTVSTGVRRKTVCTSWLLFILQSSHSWPRKQVSLAQALSNGGFFSCGPT